MRELVQWRCSMESLLDLKLLEFEDWWHLPLKSLSRALVPAMVDSDRTEQGPANSQRRLWRHHPDLWVTLRVKELVLLRTVTVLKKVQSDKCQVLGHLEIHWGMLSSHREGVARMYIWESPVYRQPWKAKGTEKVWVVTEKNGHPESPEVFSPVGDKNEWRGLRLAE